MSYSLSDVDFQFRDLIEFVLFGFQVEAWHGGTPVSSSSPND